MLRSALGIFDSSPVLTKCANRAFSSSTTLWYPRSRKCYAARSDYDIPSIACVGGLLYRPDPELLFVQGLVRGRIDAQPLDEWDEQALYNARPNEQRDSLDMQISMPHTLRNALSWSMILGCSHHVAEM